MLPKGQTQYIACTPHARTHTPVAYPDLKKEGRHDLTACIACDLTACVAYHLGGLGGLGPGCYTYGGTNVHLYMQSYEPVSSTVMITAHTSISIAGSIRTLFVLYEHSCTKGCTATTYTVHGWVPSCSYSWIWAG